MVLLIEWHNFASQWLTIIRFSLLHWLYTQNALNLFILNNECNLQLHINFILLENLKVTMNFLHEVLLSSAHPIIPRHREVERCAKMPRMREFSFLYTLLQPTKSRGITQSAEHLHLFGSDIVMLLEILHE